jgi:hypothetical protein
MNSFRPLVYPSIDANATGWVCRDSGLVQGLFSPGIASGIQSTFQIRTSGPRTTSPVSNFRIALDLLGVRFAATGGLGESAYPKLDRSDGVLFRCSDQD